MTALSRRSLLKGLPAAALALLALPAHAAFSPEEQASATEACNVQLAVTQAYTIANRECVLLTVRAERDTGAMCSALLGGYPERPRHSDGREITRQDQKDAFLFHRDRAAADSIPEALKCAERRLAARPDNRDAKRAVEYLRIAHDRIAFVDPNLPYDDPTPQPLLSLTIGDGRGGTLTLTQTEPAVVGPHGLYWDAAAQAHWMAHYRRDLIAYGLSQLTGNAAMLRALGNVREIALWQHDSQVKVAGLLAASLGDRFCDALYVGDTLTNAVGSGKPGLPEHYFALALILKDRLPPPWPILLQSYADMWRRTDDANWGIFTENEPLRKRCGPLEAR